MQQTFPIENTILDDVYLLLTSKTRIVKLNYQYFIRDNLKMIVLIILFFENTFIELKEIKGKGYILFDKLFPSQND